MTDFNQNDIEFPTVELWADPVRLKPKPKMRGTEEARAEMQGMASCKRRRDGDIPDSQDDAAKLEAAGGDDGEQQEVAVQSEGDKQELKQKAVPLPVRASQEMPRNRRQTSRGKRKIVDPRQQSIKNFFQVKDAEETGKLESSDRLNLEAADNAGLGGAAAGVGPQSEAGPSQGSEKRNRKNN